MGKHHIVVRPVFKQEVDVDRLAEALYLHVLDLLDSKAKADREGGEGTDESEAA